MIVLPSLCCLSLLFCLHCSWWLFDCCSSWTLPDVAGVLPGLLVVPLGSARSQEGQASDL